MKRYLVSYRGEFGLEVEAEDEEEAINAFINKGGEIAAESGCIEILSELHLDFFEVKKI